MTNLAQSDAQRILNFLKVQGGEASVSEVIASSGAEKLRVYPLIQRMMLSGDISITEVDAWGSPVRIALK